MRSSTDVWRAWIAVAVAGCGGTTVVFPPDGGSWGAAPIPAFASKPRLAVTDNGDDTIAIVSLDLPTPALYGFLPIGDIPVEREGPHHIAVTPDGKTILIPLSNYVPGSGAGPHGSHGLGTVPGSLLKLDARNGARIAETTIDRNPGDVLLSHDGKTAYVSHFDRIRFMQWEQQTGQPESVGYSAIAAVQVGTMARPPLYPTCPTEHGMALSPDEKLLYVTCADTDQLAILDLQSHQVQRLFVGPAPGMNGSAAYFPYAVARSPSDGTLWISCNTTGEVRVYDPATGKMDPSRTVRVGGVPLFGDFLSDGKTLLLPHQGDDQVSVIDTARAMETMVIPLKPEACLNAHVLKVMPGDKTAYVVCEGDHLRRPGTVVAIDLEAHAVLGYVTVGMFPDGIAYLPPAE